MPSQSRRYRELDAQLAKHVLSTACEHNLLDTPVARL